MHKQQLAVLHEFCCIMQSSEVMKCSRCQEVLAICPKSIYEVRCPQENKIKRVDCPSCGCCVALNFNGEWISLDTLLICGNGIRNSNGWIKVQTPKEKEVHYALSQILYREYDPPNEKLHEAVFDLPDPADIIKILWNHGHAIGFYTVKPKGTMVDATMDYYAMPTLDTAYIQRSHRRRGHAMSLMVDLVESYPNEDIGFSKPISYSMLKVLRKFLDGNVVARKRLWEVEGSGGEGNQKLIWFSFLKHN